MKIHASAALKKTLSALLALVLAFSFVGAAAPMPDAQAPALEAGIAEISKYGNIILSVGAESLRELGYEPADLIRVRIGESETVMPICCVYSEVDVGEPVCCFKLNSAGVEVISLAINGGNLAAAMGIAERRSIDSEPGFEWIFAEGLDASVTVYLSMAEKQGYAREYALRQLGAVRSNERGDYASLSDAEYANFRAVETSGMGTGTLFRSSSPVNPALNRNAEADEALLNAGIRTVMNMADSEEGMERFADFGLSHYSDCDILALDMAMDFGAADFQQKLAEGFRFLASHEGPYLIHCKEGKDRTGFACAVLECLMGADAEELIRDYMLTYSNFYGFGPDSPQYAQISASNIEATLAATFDIPSIRDRDADLAAAAEAYLARIGMSADEIAALRDRLAVDYGGLAEPDAEALPAAA